ncbi:peptide ABC transporter permease [Rhodobacteraceae bacterium WD3A24]|nr:peptide ABC transporter permease [Rhodobacteraceae bacterium WD3A24]
MSAGVFLAVLGAAFLHAGWNALIKLGAGRVTGMALFTVAQGVIGVAVIAARPLPVPEAWPWLLASGLTHAAYKGFLVLAYGAGDLSRVYPISRGAAPMMVLAATTLLLAEPMEPMARLGIIVLGAGILLMARGALRSGEARRLVPLALGTALATACYTLIDGLGARVSGDAVGYVGWLFVIDATVFAAGVIVLRGPGGFRARPRDWALGAAGASASYLAYAIAVWAMTVAPLALVAALRETSILFAVVIGWLAFGERMDRNKAAAATLIVAGVALTRL